MTTNEELLSRLHHLDALHKGRRHDELLRSARELLDIMQMVTDVLDFEVVRRNAVIIDGTIATAATFAAMAALELGRKQQALGLAESALAASSRLPGPAQELAKSLNAYALVLELHGRYREADEKYRWGLDIVQRLGRPAPELERMLRMNHAEMLVVRGEIQTGMSVMRQAPEVSAVKQRLAALNTDGVLAERQGRVEEALSCYSQARAEALAAGDLRTAGISASNLGNCRLNAGAGDRAVMDLREAQHLLRSAGAYEALGVASYNLSLAYRVLRLTEERIRSLEEAITAFGASDPPSIKSLDAYCDLAIERFVQGDMKRMRAAARRGMEVYEAVRPTLAVREEEHEHTLLRYRRLLQVHLLVSVREGWTDEVFELIERGKTRFWYESLTAAASSACPPELAADEQFAIRDMWDLTGPRSVVISFFVGPSETFVASGVSGRLLARRLMIGEEELRQLVQDARFDMQQTASRTGSLDQNVGRLSRLLFEGIQVPARTRSIFVLPDGPLWAVPFDSMPLATGESCLDDVAPVVVTPALHALRVLQARRPQVARNMLLLTVANPDVGGAADEIPGTAKQAELLDAMFPHTRTFVGRDATKAHLVREAPHSTHIHVAAHAAEADDQTGPYIVLSDGAGALSRFTDADVAKVHLDADLVFLSTCSASFGPTSAGEGLASIARAFLLAGAQCVVGTLWPIPDSEAVTLVRCFYERLREVPTVADAVQRARKDAQAQGVSRLTWAALQVLGDGLAGLDPIKTILEG